MIVEACLRYREHVCPFPVPGLALEHLAGRLHQAGRLRNGLARDRAVDFLLVITAFAAWDELLTVRNRSPAAAATAIADLAIRAVASG